MHFAPAEAAFSPEAWTIILALAGTVSTVCTVAFRFLIEELKGARRDLKDAKEEHKQEVKELRDRLDSQTGLNADLTRTSDRMLNRLLDAEEATPKRGGSP